VHGKLDFDLGDGQTFRLTAIADRIDRNEDGQLEVIDYKTGSVPTQKSVALGFHSQLTLEAAIAFRGGMEGVDPAEIGSLQYWKLSGARPAATITEVKGDPRELSEQAVEGTANLIRAFNDPKTPYLPTPRAEWSFKTNFYRHLSREGEWSKVRKTGRKPRPQPGGGKDGPK
jgi:ATP-dependent helicase/nuclease subunit B